MKKRIAAVLLAGMLLAGIAGAFSEEELSLRHDLYAYDELTVGNTTQMHGQFFTGLWGNSTSDIDVRYLLHDYNLVEWDSELGRFRVNHSVVSGALVTEDEEGNRSYLLSLYDDLRYCDGTPITAKDYAFSVLLQCDPVIAELGGKPADYSWMAGFEEYMRGETKGLTGLRIAGDYQLLFTVKHEALPYFYEMFRMSFNPYPIEVIAPGCAVYDMGEGAYIGNADETAAGCPLTAELLRETVLDPENGYMSHPKVTSGPYMLTDYDGTTASFQINPYYKGNENGAKPKIETLHYTLADNTDMVQKLANGEFGLLNKVTLAQSIHDALALTIQHDHLYTRATYPRVGLTFIVFAPGSAALQTVKTRQAVACCLDKEQMTARYTGNFGMSMDGLYGIGQWMYSLAAGNAAAVGEPDETATAEEKQQYEEELAAWEKINLDGLTRYSADTEEAARLLDEDGWTLNENGVRCRQSGEELIPLRLRMAMPQSAEALEGMEEWFLSNLRAAGIEVTVEQMDMNDLVDTYKHRETAEYDLFYLGDDFNIAFDPSVFFLDGEETGEDTLAAAHAELHRMCDEMTRTEPSDLLGFMQKWVAFQERFSQLVPMLPVYGNVYFDFFTRELHDYYPAENVSWGTAIVDAYMNATEEADEEEILELEEEFMEFDEAIG